MRHAKLLTRALGTGLMLATLGLAAPRPSPAVDLLQVVLPPSTEGNCSSVSTGVLSVLDKDNQQHVFVVRPGYHVPADVSVGRIIKVAWIRRDDGLLEAFDVKVLGTVR